MKRPSRPTGRLLVLALLTALLLPVYADAQGSLFGKANQSATVKLSLEFQDQPGNLKLHGDLHIAPEPHNSHAVTLALRQDDLNREESRFRCDPSGKLIAGSQDGVFGHLVNQWIAEKKAPGRPSTSSIASRLADIPDLTEFDREKAAQAVREFNLARFQSEFWMPLFLASQHLETADRIPVRVEQRTTIAIPLADALNLQQKWILRPSARNRADSPVSQIDIEYASLLDGIPAEKSEWRVAVLRKTGLPLVAKAVEIDPKTDFARTHKTFQFTWK